MPRKGDNIYLRQDGRWEGRYVIGKRSNGSSKFRSVYGETREEAEAKVKMIRDELEEEFKRKTSGVATLPNQPALTTRSFTFMEWFEFFLEKESGRLSEGTIKKYRYWTEKYLYPELADVPISMISCDRIQGLMSNLTDTCEKTEVDNIFYLLQQIMREALRENLLRYNPCQFVKRKRRNKAPAQFLMEYAMKGSPESDAYQIRFALCLMLETGLDMSNIVDLKWKDIDFDRKLIQLNNTYQQLAVVKLAEPDLQELALSAEACQVLKEMKCVAASESVFNYDEERWSEDEMTSIYEELRDAYSNSW
ncbi:tyrosine-type recombinase/integrase [Enterococcus sp. 669A]|uniref:Tyrosine-type recombinase/integrase n=1 Tax=Candidatus Enterococcus moelleringii TaxID=2815325 RepID=A0ABS3LGM5_9ENTE|nr:tyrosine-type recombinase/integrase [Enterococcus sp. 669A]MBO1308797.1 tyrosine-type recombinase/integrase [Enterococcus sp. 669A]